MLTEQQEQLLIGSLLGDGRLSLPTRGKNPRYTENHAIAQGDYLKWKHEILLQIGHSRLAIRHKTSGKGDKKYETLSLTTGCNEKFIPYYKAFYPEGKKVVPNLIDRLGPLGLAVWYMDDGSIHRETRAFLHSPGFTDEGRQLLLKVLNDNFKLYPVIRDNGRFSFNKCSERFFEIVRPFIQPVIYYKLPR